MAGRPLPRGFMRAFFRLPVLMYHGPLAALAGKRLCVLTTRGRRTGSPRSTGLNYAQEDTTVYVMSGWGTRTDWYRNLVRDPHVTVRIGRSRWDAIATTVADGPARRHGIALIKATARRQGPPRLIRPLLARLGFDYQRELETLDVDAPGMPLVALARVTAATR